MKWALNTYQTAQEWSLEETLEIAKETGYDAVEWLMDFDQPHGFEWDTPRERWKPMKETIARSGIVSSSLTSCQVFHHPDPADREESIRRVQRVIEMAEYFECPNVRVLGDRFTDENRDEVIGWVIEALRRLGEFAAPKGITVSMEMHGSFSDPEASVAVVEGVDLPNVGLIFNGQFVGCEPGSSIGDWLDRFIHHVTSVHTHSVEDPAVFDFYRQMFDRLKAIGFDGYISNECAYRGPDPKKVLALYVALFRALAGE